MDRRSRRARDCCSRRITTIWRIAWTEREGLRAWRGDSPEATSFRPDGHGGYYVVEQTNRRLVRWRADGTVEPLAERFEGPTAESTRMTW